MTLIRPICSMAPHVGTACVCATLLLSLAQPVVATDPGSGGTATTLPNGDVVRTFAASGTLTLESAVTARILLVGGGGGGGFATGGGGGAGGMTEVSDVALAAGTYTVTVGAGGSAASSNKFKGTNGGNSSFVGGTVSLSVLGGGGGGTYRSGTELYDGSDGGSGGGGSRYPTGNGTSVGGKGTDGQGHDGGEAVTSNYSYSAGGGGGAGAAGGDYASNHSGDGGAGLASDITGESITYAGGGGGGSGKVSSTSLSAGTGGAGGGGNGIHLGDSGVTYDVPTDAHGTDGLGGGGGGGGYSGRGGNGGSGIVIVRYAPDTSSDPNPIVFLAAAEPASDGSAELAYRIPTFGEGASSGVLSVAYGLDGDSLFYTNVLATVSATGASTATLSGLLPGRSYTAVLVLEAGSKTSVSSALSFTMPSDGAVVSRPSTDPVIATLSVSGNASPITTVAGTMAQLGSASASNVTLHFFYGETADRSAMQEIALGALSGSSFSFSTATPALNTDYYYVVEARNADTGRFDRLSGTFRIDFDITYSWKSSVSDGAWTDPANWECNLAAGQGTYPTAGTSAVFTNAAGIVTVRIAGPQCADTLYMGRVGALTGLSFVGTTADAALTAGGYGLLGQTITADALALTFTNAFTSTGTTAATVLSVAAHNGAVVTLPRVEITGNSSFVADTGASILLPRTPDAMLQSWWQLSLTLDNGLLESTSYSGFRIGANRTFHATFSGTNPVFRTKYLRGTANTATNYFVFNIPRDGYVEPPVQTCEHNPTEALMYHGFVSVSVDADSAIAGRTSAAEIQLIDWPSKGINTNAVELVALPFGDASYYYWTYDGTTATSGTLATGLWLHKAPGNPNPEKPLLRNLALDASAARSLRVSGVLLFVGTGASTAGIAYRIAPSAAGLDSAEPRTVATGLAEGDEFSFAIPRLADLTTYYVRLYATNDQGESYASDTLTATTISSVLGMEVDGTDGYTTKRLEAEAVHTFLSNNTFRVIQPHAARFLLVGGGGAGGTALRNITGGVGKATGGGGGGGVLETNIFLDIGSYEVVVGMGGEAQPNGYNLGTDGGDTALVRWDGEVATTNLLVHGGGNAALYHEASWAWAGHSGGCGGAGACFTTNGLPVGGVGGAAKDPSQGFAGAGDKTNTILYGHQHGGGGAGEAGHLGNVVDTDGHYGNGGAGRASDITGETAYYGGGGGGGYMEGAAEGTEGVGGLGGGGHGVRATGYSSDNDHIGVDGLGGGGGGTGYVASDSTRHGLSGGRGGSGVLILRAVERDLNAMRRTVIVFW